MIQHNYSWRMCGSHMGKHPLQLHICSITAEPSSRTAPSKLCVRRPQFPFEREAPAGARAIDGSPATLCAISLSTPVGLSLTLSGTKRHKGSEHRGKRARGGSADALIAVEHVVAFRFGFCRVRAAEASLQRMSSVHSQLIRLSTELACNALCSFACYVSALT